MFLKYIFSRLVLFWLACDVFQKLGTASETESYCLAKRQSSLKFTIKTFQNRTGHRALAFDAQNESNMRKEETDGPTFEVSHTTSSSNNVQRIDLSVTALFPGTETDGYELFNGLGYYKLHTNAEKWETARQICLSEGADLMVVNSENEFGVIKEFYSRNPMFTFTGSGHPDYLMVGFSDKAKEGVYVTVKGYPLENAGYLKWDNSEPTGNTDQNYGAISKYGFLHDVINNYSHGFICEKDL